MDPEIALRQLAQLIENCYRGVTFTPQGSNESHAIGWFRGEWPGSVHLMASITSDGQIGLLSSEGLNIEESLGRVSEEQVAAYVFSLLEPIARGGLVVVRTLPFLGRLSPSWVGGAGTPEIVAALRGRCARIVIELSGWPAV